ncbi:MAG: hypothetical protein PHV37_09095 [Candidatus Gastranaerophilales bacterium]|nr:hypothetical protein [Candidatus Gastranaerophilales bacterium]
MNIKSKVFIIILSVAMFISAATAVFYIHKSNKLKDENAELKTKITQLEKIMESYQNDFYRCSSKLESMEMENNLKKENKQEKTTKYITDEKNPNPIFSYSTSVKSNYDYNNTEQELYDLNRKVDKINTRLNLGFRGY